MSLSRQIAFWVAGLVVIIGLTFLLHDMLLPFVAGLIIAYFLDPLARRLERLGLGRLGAATAIVIIGLLVTALASLLVFPLLGNQLAGFAEKLPDTVHRLQTLVAEQGGPLLERLGGQSVIADIQRSLGDILTQGAGWAGKFLSSLWSGGQALFGIVSLFVVAPVVAFYMLLDWDSMIAKVDSWLPRTHAETIRGIMRDMDRAIAGFVRGQALVCLLLGTYYAIGLSLVGLNFALLIGFAAGLLSFIPFVGSITGLVVALVVAIVQFWPDWTMIVLVLAVFFSGQFIEGNILSPKLVGESVGLHPVWLMFALVAFGSLFGFVGLLLAVPLAAAIGVLVRFALKQYLASPLYDPALAEPPPDGKTPR